MLMVSSTDGWSTMIGWKRRSRAASFSMCLRYSSSVVAPMARSSPRARAGLRRLAASMAPSAAPAPISVCSSSMNRTTWPFELSISLSTAFSELAAELGTGDERSEIESDHPLALEPFRHITLSDALGEAFGDGGLAYAGFSDED